VERPERRLRRLQGRRQRGLARNLDLGEFVYDADGLRWAWTSGPTITTCPATSAQALDYYRMRTEGQNTLTIDGANQNLKGKAKITLAFRARAQFAVAISATATRVRRRASRAVCG
jgi:hypothetical protein